MRVQPPPSIDVQGREPVPSAFRPYRCPGKGARAARVPTLKLGNRDQTDRVCSQFQLTFQFENNGFEQPLARGRSMREEAFVVAHTASVSHAEALTGAGKVMHADTAPARTERMLTETP